MHYYLKNNIKFAPYIWNWYAWGHLIAPHTAAMNIVERHIKIMESFIANPELHHQAIHQAGMMGGPFLNIDPKQKDRIQSLLQATKTECAKLIALHADCKKFDAYLQTTARGQSLETIYNHLPMSLRGMVELTYNLHNHPQIRFIEALFYKKYYDVSQQKFCLGKVENDQRTFCLSTPHIADDQTLELQLPFVSQLVDKLVAMRQTPGNPFDLLNELNIPPNDMPLFKSFFTELAPAQMETNYDGDGVRVRYIGHACVLLQTRELNILLDPVFGYNYDGERTDRYTFENIPDVIDYVVITHNHQDHFLFETLLQLRHKIKQMIVPSCNKGALQDPSLKLILQHIGFHHVLTVDEFDEINLGEHAVLTALPFLGEHGDLDIQSKRAYHFKIKNRSFLFLADSNNLDHYLYEHIFANLAPIDTVFIGMECQGAPASWLYGPLFTQALQREADESRRLSGSDCKKAWRILKAAQCREVYIYAMGLEPWLSYILTLDYNKNSPPIVESDRLLAMCAENNIHAERVYGKKEWIYSYDL